MNTELKLIRPVPELPPKNIATSQGRAYWELALTELASIPGQWAIIRESDLSTNPPMQAHGWANGILASAHRWAIPAGCYQVAVREGKLYARYEAEIDFKNPPVDGVYVDRSIGQRISFRRADAVAAPPPPPPADLGTRTP